MLVSFDFDDTLLLTRPDEDWGLVEAGPNVPMLVALRAHAAAGDTVIIVTSRMASREFEFQQRIGAGGQLGCNIEPPRTPVAAFVAAHKLPVASVHFTEGKDKAEALASLGVAKHFDDDEHELEALQGTGIEGVQAPIHPAWGDPNET